MFNKPSVKVSVLEAKFQIYEDLSKEMLDKLERAVDKISESNQSVALILERHEQRLEASTRVDDAIMELIKDIKVRMDRFDHRVTELSNFRWKAVGIGTAAVIVLGSASFFSNVLTIGVRGASMGGENIQHSK